MPMSAQERDKIQRDRLVSKADLPQLVGLRMADIEELLQAGVFPAATSSDGTSWHPMKVAAWNWGLKESTKLAMRVEATLGKRVLK